MDIADKTPEEYSIYIASEAFSEKVKPYLKENEYNDVLFRGYHIAEERYNVTAYVLAEDGIYIFHYGVNPDNGEILEFRPGAKMIKIEGFDPEDPWKSLPR